MTVIGTALSISLDGFVTNAGGAKRLHKWLMDGIHRAVEEKIGYDVVR